MAFLCVTVITAALGAYAVHSIAEGARLVIETYDDSLMSISFARAAAVDFATMEGLAARRRLVADATAQQELASRIDELADTLSDDLAVAAERSRSVRAAAAANAVSQAAAAWQSAERALRTEDPAAARSATQWKPLDTASAAVANQVDLLVNFTAGDAFLHRQQALAAIGRDRLLNIASTFAALLLSGVIVVVLARRIIRPLAEASAVATRIAHGELETAIPAGGADELGVLLRAMAVMRDSIRAMMGHEIAQRRSAQGRLVDAIEGSNEGVVLVDSDDRIVVANSQLGRFFPAVAPDLRPGSLLTELMEEQAVRDSFASTVPTEVRLDDGRWLRISRSGNREGGFVAICGDITVEKQREAALTHTNRLFDAALNNMSQGLCLYNHDHRLLVSNRQFAELFRLAPDATQPGMRFRQILAMSFAADRIDAIHAACMDLVNDRQSGTQLQELGDGRVIAISHEPMDDGGWVATYEDVTERRRAEARIDFLARHDALTALPNRVMFRECLDQALAQLGRGHGFAVLIVDLDHFKSINDTLGHPIGDRLLLAVAERLRDCARETDMVARLGGDEFAVVQAGVARPDDAAELAGRIVRALGEPFLLDGHPVLIGASIGIAVAGTDGTSVDRLLKNADLALYRAKQDGRGAYRCFEPEMDARLRARHALELDLRHAVANDEFELFFQPLIDLRTNRVSGFEALIRWWHPVRGMVSPAEFIPVAEDSGLIVEIGEWVIRRACFEAMSWPGPLKVAVNVSPSQFKSARLVTSVTDALETSGLPAGRLELEITESVLLADNDASLATLRRLHELGAKISMDDFGTGYSSLSYLRSFPFDKIKIDQSFVRDLDMDEDSRAIVRAIISLGHSLGIQVLAEGVETAEQLERLRGEGCGEAQGYIFSPPRPGGEVLALIERLGIRLREMA